MSHSHTGGGVRITALCRPTVTSILVAVLAPLSEKTRSFSLSYAMHAHLIDDSRVYTYVRVCMIVSVCVFVGGGLNDGLSQKRWTIGGQS